MVKRNYLLGMAGNENMLSALQNICMQCACVWCVYNLPCCTLW